jgi:hypothetical protein
MKWLRGAGLLLGSAAIWTGTLWLQYHHGPAFPLGLFTLIAAIGLPAFFAAALAYRFRLPQPVAWAVAGYCLGAGLFTAVNMPPPQPLARYLSVALAHAASLTILAPATDGSFVPLPANLLYLSIAVFTALYGVDAYRGPRNPAPRADPPSRTG